MFLNTSISFFSSYIKSLFHLLKYYYV